ncbi:MAG TPA: hypothetical protein VLT35_04055 [Methanocella sp.]|nr:hypothetical protein [Methanocella sp.]
MKAEKATRPKTSRLDEVVKKVRMYDDARVITRLKHYGIAPDDYEVEMNVYHSEERRGVPYLTLLIHKALPKDKQAELAMELSRLDSTLCVIFKK